MTLLIKKENKKTLEIHFIRHWPLQRNILTVKPVSSESTSEALLAEKSALEAELERIDAQRNEFKLLRNTLVQKIKKLMQNDKRIIERSDITNDMIMDAVNTNKNPDDTEDSDEGEMVGLSNDMDKYAETMLQSSHSFVDLSTLGMELDNKIFDLVIKKEH